MPAISKLRPRPGRHASQLVVVAGTSAETGWKDTRWVLPVAHGGAVKRATRGFCVACTVGLPPVPGGVATKSTVRLTDSPVEKSLATTWIWYFPAVPVRAN